MPVNSASILNQSNIHWKMIRLDSYIFRYFLQYPGKFTSGHLAEKSQLGVNILSVESFIFVGAKVILFCVSRRYTGKSRHSFVSFWANHFFSQALTMCKLLRVPSPWLNSLTILLLILVLSFLVHGLPIVDVQ